MDIKRILIVDSNPLVRRGLAEVIASEPDLDVYGALSTCSEAITTLTNFLPDLLITDLSIEATDDGLNLLKYIQPNYPDLPVMILTTRTASYYVDLALQSGARGYLSKSEEVETLLTAIRKILDGHQYVYPEGDNSAYDVH